MMNDFQILCYRLRNLSLTDPRRSEKYKEFLREKFPHADEPHHVFGSTIALKSTDFLAIMVTRAEHNEIQHKPVTIEQIVGAVDNLLEYTAHLEDENFAYEKTIDHLSGL